jgi:hypothetical protein
MMLLAIDPGTTESAYVVMDDNLRIIKAEILPNDILLDCIGFTPIHAMAIEMIEGLGMPVGKETFETVWWIGRFCQASRAPFHRIYRKDVKLHLCGNHRAKDANIRQALLDKLGPQGTKKNPGPTYGISKHMWSALAVGVTYLESGAR